ncbi:hypothetical protein BDF20DRAFT_418006 [Mycotypha africana]|uniref:uncharacterized protein n=1 Tax=Mycotypha africana TaxID=64632 RepID=UPI002300F67E|nr:uncharacterized protein BDF20DRAFT_418006 [Mycotypha africana]KAI8981647.1 hypothetical protein BDF20DRAFT_418006 [Mycotypha africana]
MVSILILRWYTMLFWIDCLISTITTVWFAVSWFVYTDHNLPESADNPGKMAEHDIVFKLESRVSIAVLIVLRLIHFYFAYVVTRYYKAITQISYSRLVASDNIDLEDTSFSNKDASTSESAFKPAQD